MHIVKPLASDRPLGPQVIRHLRRLLREVSSLMETESADDGQEAVHQARRCLKAMAALSALLRRTAEGPQVRAIRTACREALRCLGTLRDPHVIRQLVPTATGPVMEGGMPAQAQQARKKVRHLVEDMLHGVHGLRVHHARRGASRALQRSWRKTARSARRAWEAPDPTSLHALRRQAIRLRIQGNFMSRIRDLPAGALKTLCADLGDHHDLAMALEHADPDQRIDLRARSEELQRRALERARRLFGD